MAFLEELQKQPSYKKKIIIWCVLIVLGALMLILWGMNFRKKLTSFQKENLIESFNVPDLKAKMDNMPQLEIPEPDAEEIRKIEEEINNLEKEDRQQL